MSAVELLREAAQAMRERANAATPGPWEADGSEIYGNPRHEHWVGETLKGGEAERTDADSAHIASWDPAVALAVADWLDGVAEDHRAVDRVDEATGECIVRTVVGGEGRTSARLILPALAVARAYLGRDEP